MKIKFNYEKTQAYCAGALTAKLYNIYYTRVDLPSVVECMRDFKYLKTTFGRYYNLLKGHKYGNTYILKYEEFNTLQLFQKQIGTYTHFMIGFSDYINRDRL